MQTGLIQHKGLKHPRKTKQSSNQSTPNSLHTSSPHSLWNTEYLGTVLCCEWDWCSIIIPLPSHISSHPQTQRVGDSHHSYTYGHGGALVHVNLLKTLTQWLEQPFHQTLELLFISFPFFINSWNHPVSSMKWYENDNIQSMFINNRVPSKLDNPTNTINQNHSINNQYVFIILNISLNSLFMSIINSNDTSFITTAIIITLYSSYSFLHSFIPPSLTHHSYHPFHSFLLFSITIHHFSHSSLCSSYHLF